MYAHPSYIYNAFVVEQERIDRANELRRIIAENPERVVRHEGSFARRVRGWFRGGGSDAAASAIASETPRGAADVTARPAHAR
ncbi:hypothetical protein [Microbacterium sp.]|uniref:hypothetical protein n=1 Tax=Microbacterium sp. TaxID=51671 RepID=UPI003F9D76F2